MRNGSKNENVIIRDNLAFLHENTIDVCFVFFIDDVNNVVPYVQTISFGPYPSIDVFETEIINKIIWRILNRTIENKFQVSETLLLQRFNDIFPKVTMSGL